MKRRARTRSGKPAGKGRRRGGDQGMRQPPYTLQREPDGRVTVLRDPMGNRAVPTNCGTMPNLETARALIRNLRRAESVLDDLFLEATDDGIEALETILERCRTAALAGQRT